MKTLLATVLVLAGAIARSQTVTTIIGKATVRGDTVATSSPLADAKLNGPAYLYKDTAGRIWFTENLGNRVRMFDGVNVYVRAGSLNSAGGSKDSTGIESRFNGPTGIVVDRIGNIFVLDVLNNAIRKISPFTTIQDTQTVTTFAGDKTAGFADGTGTNAKFNQPYGILVDGDNNLYVSDTKNKRIRKITPAGVVTTFAGSNLPGSKDGIGTAATFWSPTIMCWYSTTEFLVIDGGSCIRKVDITTGAVTTTTCDNKSNHPYYEAYEPSDMAFDSSGTIYVADKNSILMPLGSCVVSLAGYLFSPGSDDGIGRSAHFNGITGILYENKSLFVCDKRNHTIRKVTIEPIMQDLPKALFDAPDQTGTTDDIIAFRDFSSNAVDWSWTITPNTYVFKNATSATSQNPYVMFTAKGSYTISQKAISKCFGSDSFTRANYITIGNVGLPTAVSEASVSVYPNPAKGLFHIATSLSEKLDITIYDMQGKVLLVALTSNTTATLDVQNAPKGMYFMMIKGESSYMVKKIVVE